MSTNFLRMPSFANTKSMVMTFRELSTRAVLGATLSADFAARGSMAMTNYMPTVVTATNDATFAIDSLQPGNTNTISTIVHWKATFRRTTTSVWIKSA